MKVFRRVLNSLLLVPDTPERTAFAFSLGVFLGFSPLLGLHTVLALALALLLRSNKVAILLGVWSNGPWICVPFYAFATWLGLFFIQTPAIFRLPETGLAELLTLEFWQWLGSQWRFLLPTVVGSLILCSLLALASYPLALFTLRRVHRLRARSQELPPEVPPGWKPENRFG